MKPISGVNPVPRLRSASDRCGVKTIADGLARGPVDYWPIRAPHCVHSFARGVRNGAPHDGHGLPNGRCVDAYMCSTISFAADRSHPVLSRRNLTADTDRPFRISASVCSSCVDMAPGIGAMNLPHLEQVPPLLGSRSQACSELFSSLLERVAISKRFQCAAESPRLPRREHTPRCSGRSTVNSTIRRRPLRSQTRTRNRSGSHFLTDQAAP